MASSCSYLHLILFRLMLVPSLLSLMPSCHCVDPPPLQDYCIVNLSSNMNLNGYPCKNPSDVTSDDFCYKGFLNDNKVFNIYGLSLSQATVNNFPGLNSPGISLIQAELLNGGVVRPQTHPRASELVVCTKGRVFVGFVTTDNLFLYKILKPKMVFVAMLHIVINVGKGKALLCASFNSQHPGIQYVPQSLFNSTLSVPDAALSISFRANDSIVEFIKSNNCNNNL